MTIKNNTHFYGRLCIRTAAILLFAVGQSSGANARSLNCPSKCNSVNNPYCMIVPSLVVGPDMPWALRNLYLLETPKYPNITITPSKMLAFFGMEPSEDPSLGPPQLVLSAKGAIHDPRQTTLAS